MNNIYLFTAPFRNLQKTVTINVLHVHVWSVSSIAICNQQSWTQEQNTITTTMTYL